MDLGVISVRYARALLKSATELKNADLVYQNMVSLSDCYINVPSLRSTIDNPMLQRSKKLHLLTTALGQSPQQLSVRFLELVLKEDRKAPCNSWLIRISLFIDNRRISPAVN